MPDTAVTHHTENVNGIDLHWVEAGPADGRLVILVHGFPESWYSWRHQIAALADAGYRAVAIDVRGYGGSSRPSAIEDYRMLRHVGDNVGLVHALGAETATIVGHDWGAPIAWTSAQLRPDLFTAVAGLSVPFSPSGRRRPTEAMAQAGGDDEDFYISYFQAPGVVEAEILPDVRRWLLGIYYSISGDGVLAAGRGPRGALGLVPRGDRLSDQFVYPVGMPEWLTEADVDFYAGEFAGSDFFGPLARYRNIDRDWEDLAAFSDVPITVPSLFVAGEYDGPAITGRRQIERFDKTLPGLTRSVVLPRCGHWVQQERPAETNQLLLEFLTAASRRS
ncbi:alpha/beta fold hydrolase [Nocardioides sp. NPDC057767]|uniref:alpha/beta fold hydrolase n=1 Tax=unclassified Nocardioides TaxID=2615069 RepID=UPI00366D8EDA